MPKIFLKLFLAAVPLFLFTCQSFGQECQQRSKEWNPYSTGPIATWTAPVVCKGNLSVQPLFFYNHMRGTFDKDGHFKHFKGDDAKSEFQEVLFLQYGLFERFDVSVQGTYQQVTVHKDGDGAAASEFNDTYLYLRYCLLDETDWLPVTTAVFQLKFPTGKYQKPDPRMLEADIVTPDTGGGAYDEGCGLNFTKKIKPFILHADFIFGFPNPTRVNGINTKYGSYLLYDAAVEYFFYGPFHILAEANGLTQGDRKDNGYSKPSTSVGYLNLTAGLGWSDDDIQMLLAYQRTIAGVNTDVSDSVIATFVYTF